MPSIDKAYQWAVQTCQSHNARYVWGAALGQIVNGHPAYDCSSFISSALRAGGFKCGRMTTSGMESALASMGFRRVTDGSVRPGDIGLNVGSHTEMAYSSGSNRTAIFMGAHSSHFPPQYQVSIGSYQNGSYNPQYKRGFNQTWRYGNGASGSEGDEPSSGKGYSPYVVSAICGNWYHESGCNPGVWESLTPVAWDALYSNHTGGYGLGQWTNTSSGSGMRLYRLYQWMTSNHYSMGSMDGELEYFAVENHWTHLKSYSVFNSLSDFLNSDSTDLSMLVTQFLACWEGVPGNVLNLRIQYAQTIYAYITAHANDPTPTPISNNTYLSEADRLSNSLYIYKKLGTSGTGNSRPASGESKKKSMPIWMMLRNLF